MVEVNEAELMEIMANDKQTYLPGMKSNHAVKEPELPANTENAPDDVSEPNKVENPASETDTGKSQRKRKSQKADFAEVFLRERAVKNRKQIYISAETYDLIRSYLKYIGDVSFIAYVDNVLLQHIEEYKDNISELFNKKVNPF